MVAAEVLPFIPGMALAFAVFHTGLTGAGGDNRLPVPSRDP